MSRRGGAARAFGVAAVVGLVGGWLLSVGNRSAHRSDLFSASSWRRFGALGWLERHGGPESVEVLRDYLAWEQLGVLRSRGRQVLRRLQGSSA